MVPEKNPPASHAGEDQSSPDVFAARDAYLANALAGVLGAAKTLANTYLKEERVSPAACFNADHHQAVVGLFSAIERADSLGMSLAGAAQLSVAGQVKVDIWSVLVEPFCASSLSELIEQNEWLRPGDVVYKAETVYRHTLTDADFEAAVAPAAIGGAV